MHTRQRPSRKPNPMVHRSSRIQATLRRHMVKERQHKGRHTLRTHRLQPLRLQPLRLQLLGALAAMHPLPAHPSRQRRMVFPILGSPLGCRRFRQHR